ncbi:MAG: TIGR04282 family arsenosugar biosynthesis glycosyltransferase [Sulfuriflexus sp.]|nr:TIGR04282 family arsenosugar biosynthesis glycosyltransferase [Sulfuriflexus sp.]
MTGTCVCVFAKAPVSGQVKTRLLPVLSEQQACLVHERLIQHCLSRIQHPDWQTQLWSTDISHPYIQACAENHSVSLHTQQGIDLGERMASAVQQSLEHFKHVIIIGTDCPSIDAGFIQEAVKKLKAGVDVVLGPAEDGGYVLIGFSLSAENVFTGIEWGTDQVLESTRLRLRDAKLNWHELETQRDIDRPEDLQYLEQAYPLLFRQ